MKEVITTQANDTHMKGNQHCWVFQTVLLVHGTQGKPTNFSVRSQLGQLQLSSTGNELTVIGTFSPAVDEQRRSMQQIDGEKDVEL